MIIQKSSKVLLFAILIISFFGMNLNKSEAQPPCPTGFTLRVMTFNINGCNYTAQVCYKCAPIALDATIVNPITTFSKVDTNCAPSPTLTDAEILAEINIGVMNRIYLAQLCEIKPCGVDPKVRMLFAKYACWKNGSIQGKYDACTSEPYCETMYEACVDNGVSPPIISWTIVGTPTWVGGAPSCPLPPSGIIPNLPNSTCYLLNGTCP